MFSRFFKRFQRKRRTYSPRFSDYRKNTIRLRKPLKAASPRQEKPTRREQLNLKKRRRLLVASSLVLGLSALSFFVFGTSWFQIQAIQITHDEAALEEKATVNLYLQEFLGDNLLFFDKDQHESTLLSEHPYLKRVNIHRGLFSSSLEVDLQSYLPVLNLKAKNEDGTEVILILNEAGFVSSRGEENAKLPMLVYMDPLEEKPETTVISEERLQNILKAQREFEAKFGMKILQSEYYQAARELHLYTEREFWVWIDLEKDIDLQFGKLKKVSNELGLYDAPLLYIDLRISGQNGEKVIYKLIEP